MNAMPHVLQRLGLPALASALILAWAAWTHWMIEPALADDISALQRQTRDVSVPLVAHPAPLLAPRALLRAFCDRLPADSTSNATLSGVLKQAKAEGLVVDSARFETEGTRVPGVVRHQADLPLKGSYVAVRRWLAHSLQDNAGLTLDALVLKRRDANANDVDATVTLSLWARTTPDSSASNGGPERGH